MHEFPCFYGNDAHAPTVVSRPFFLAPAKTAWERGYSSACASATVQPPPQLQGRPQPPQVCVPQRSDVGTNSAESIRQLGDEEMYNNAFRPDPFPVKEEYGKKLFPVCLDEAIPMAVLFGVE